jgi:glycosyltransferase involved in cell wall biosynthesis
MSDSAISVVIPVFNKREFVAISLQSVVTAADLAGDVDLVIVDHHSTDGSYEVALTHAPRATVLRVTGGTISAVRNFGARHATAPVISFIDSDVVVPPEYFRILKQVLSEIPADAVGCEYDVPDHPHWSERVWHDLHVVREDGYRHFINAGNFAVRRPAFDAVDGFDERLVTGEDTDICARLAAKGYRVFETHRLRAVHLGNPKSLVGFFRKQVWHGLGGFSWVMFRRPNKATAMIVAHAIAVFAAVAILAGVGRLPLLPRVASAVALAMFAPLATVAYRYAETRRFVNPVGAVWLYTLFYSARVEALIVSLVRRRPRVDPIANVATR